jgi:hypothetical protein
MVGFGWIILSHLDKLHFGQTALGAFYQIEIAANRVTRSGVALD